MVDLSLVPEQQAIDFLNAMDIDLQFLTKRENSSSVEVGCVIRTDPVDGEPLEKGQTVYLWISTGPLKQTAKVPRVVGLNRTAAETILVGSKFNNLTFEEIESPEPVGTVVDQSIAEGIEVDINTQIVLQVSKGISSSTGDQPPVTQPDDLVSIVIPVQFENPLEKDCILTIWNGTELIAQRQVFAGTVSAEVRVWGEGFVTFTAKLDGDDATAWTFQVDFTDDDLGL